MLQLFWQAWKGITIILTSLETCYNYFDKPGKPGKVLQLFWQAWKAWKDEFDKANADRLERCFCFLARLVLGQREANLER